jgi:MFS family permease
MDRAYNGMTDQRRQAGPLRSTPFRRTFLAIGASAMGDSFTLVALPIAFLQIGEGPKSFGYVLAVRTLLLILFILPGGVLSDKLAPQRLLAIANLVRFASQSAIAAALLTGHGSVLTVAILYAMHGAASAFAFPASQKILPSILPVESLQSGNALISATFSGGAIIGPLLAGILLAFADPGAAILVDGGSFLVSSILMLGVRSIKPSPPPPAASGDAKPASVDRPEAAPATSPSRAMVRKWGSDLREGFREIARRPWLAAGLGHAALFQVFVLGAVAVLGPTQSIANYGGERAWPTLLITMSVGHLGGGLVALNWKPRNTLLMTYVVLFGPVPALICFASRMPFLVMAATLYIYGVTLSIGNTLWATTLQVHIRPDRLGRVLSFDGLVSYGLQPVGFILLGTFGSLLGAKSVLLSTAGLAAAANLAVVTLRSTRQATAPRDKAPRHQAYTGGHRRDLHRDGTHRLNGAHRGVHRYGAPRQFGVLLPERQ